MDHLAPSHDSIRVRSWVPTAMQLAAPLHETATSEMIELLPEMGVFTSAQALPFQDSVSGLATPWLKFSPTAMQLVGPPHETPVRSSLALFGLGVTDHMVPFHVTMRVWCLPAEVSNVPTATHSVGLTHDTALRALPANPR